MIVSQEAAIFEHVHVNSPKAGSLKESLRSSDVRATANNNRRGIISIRSQDPPEEQQHADVSCEFLGVRIRGRFGLLFGQRSD